MTSYPKKLRKRVFKFTEWLDDTAFFGPGH